MIAQAVVAPCTVSAAEHGPSLSLYEEAHREAERHKWIESERHGRDLGDSAIRDWYHRHWPRYCRYGRLAHVRGTRLYNEFGDEAFGCIYALIVSGDLLTDRILDRIDAGDENLTIIYWAHQWGLPIERVVEILKKIDINRARLDPAF